MLNGNGGICVPPETMEDPTGRTAKRMRSTFDRRVKRTLTALLLMFVLSFTSVFAEPEPAAEGTAAEEVKTEAITETGGSEDPAKPPAEEPPQVEPPKEEPPAATAKIIKKGRYYYYKYANGKIRKSAGFVTLDGKKYYVRKGGKIRTGTTFKINKKYYRANKYGVIMTGVYKWSGSLYYSDASGVLRKTAGFVTWNDNRYYVKKGGKIIKDEGFTVKNIPYAADPKGCVTMLEIPDGDGSPVVDVAKAQVGIMTGKTYWVWYYKTRFVDTDRTPWCGAFVAWVYNAAGMYNKITVAKKFGPLGYVPVYSRYADKYRKWVSRYSAKGGDIVVFGRNMHVGLVEGISGDYLITIEGNAGPTAAIGSRKPGAVIRNVYKLNSKRIKGVIRPN